MVRVRYAPSPTGTLHIGGARTALFNYLYARHQDGQLILRVEDTDQSRQIPGSEASMIRGLKSLGIVWDEGPDREGRFGPYRQSERLPRHQAMVERLLKEQKAYRCFCSPEQLGEDRRQMQAQGLQPRYNGRCRNLSSENLAERAGQRSVVRLKVPGDGETVVRDLIRGEVHFENRVLDDFVIMKPNNLPVYNFAVVVDDHDMAITHVIRGEEHLSNTPKQILVYEALGFEVPSFAHLPMILAPDRSKLSKRHGATAVEEYRDQGIMPKALANYLLLLGWSDPNGREVMTLSDAEEHFTLERVQHTAAIYDLKKLEWMNHQYMTRLPVNEIIHAVRPFITYDLSDGPALEDAVALCRERAFTLVQLADVMAFLYQAPESYDPQGVNKHFSPASASRLHLLAERLQYLDSWDHEALLGVYDQLSAELSIKRAELIHPTRLAVTGRTVGPGLFELLVLTGREKTLMRLKNAAEGILAGILPLSGT